MPDVVPRININSSSRPTEVNHKTVDIHRRRFTEADVRAILKRNDKNKDNVLDWYEINQAFKELGAWCPPYRAWCGIWHADGDGDGKISEGELKPLIDYIISLNYTPVN